MRVIPLPIVRPSRETLGERMTKHGHTKNDKGYTRTYTSWLAMKARCDNPEATAYDKYGAAGISYAERWASFENFLADMGERPERTTLDRWPRADGNYEPGNCRWATWRQQRLNRKTTKAVVRSDGLRFPSIIEAAEATGSNRQQIRDICNGRGKMHRGFSWSYA